jgi:hypothetical protein
MAFMSRVSVIASSIRVVTKPSRAKFANALGSDGSHSQSGNLYNGWKKWLLWVQVQDLIFFPSTMFIPLSVLDTASLPKGSSLGEHLGDCLSKTEIQSLAQCLYSGPEPAIYSPDPARPPLNHDELRTFVSNFVLPHAANRPPLKQNDRIMVVLPPGPENAVALLALGNYHSCAPINASCTAIELKVDALRLQAKAIITSKDIGRRLNLESLQEEFNCQIFYITGRISGPAGLFDVFMPEDTDVVISSRPAEAHGLDDISLILHTSGTSGKKKVVRYSLRTLLVGTWCIVHSWDLKPGDINCM